MLAYSLNDVLILLHWVEVIWVLDQSVKVDHSLHNVPKIGGSLILEWLQKVGQDNTLREDFLYFIKHLKALLLNVGSLDEYTLNQWETDWAQMFN